MKHRILMVLVLALAALVPAFSQSQPAPADSVRLVPVTPYFYFAVEMKGSYEQTGGAFQNLYQQAGMQGLPMTSTPFGVYWNNPSKVPVDSLRWELGLALPESRTVAAPLVLKKWEFPLVASLVFEGVYGSDAQAAAYKKVTKWILWNGYTPAGPSVEKFLSQPTQTADGGYSGQVEIIVPVKEAK
jgi:DNA gyrase inhibitor GyrI